MSDDLKNRAMTSIGRVEQSQADVAAIRRQPISDRLDKVLSHAAKEAGVTVNVTSGGQPHKGSGGPRTGSTRHDGGNAADLTLHDASGRMLDFTNKADRPTFEKFVSAATAAGATGIGAGVGYMGPNTIHVGFGKKASWGGARWVAPAMRAGAANPVNVGGTSAQPSPQQVEQQAARHAPGTLAHQVVTNYWPIKGGRDVGIEGSDRTSRPGPDGRENRVSTLEDFRTGKSDYVTIAAKPSHYGEWYTIPEYSYVNAKGELHTLHNIPAYVHDTGSAFTHRADKFDIAADYGTSDRHGARLDRANGNLRAGTVFVPSEGRPVAVAQAGPKPGSAEYWSQGKAKPVAVAENSAPAPERAASGGQTSSPAPAGAKTADAAPGSNSRAGGRGRYNGARSPASSFDGADPGSYFGGASLRAAATETEIPDTEGEVHIRIDVPMSVV